jgi:plastocyanin
MKKVVALLALVLAATALAACGGDNGTTTTETGGEAAGGAAATGAEGGEGGAAAAGSTVQLEADPGGGIAYTTEEVGATAGDVTIEFDNPQPIEHDVAVEDSNGEEVGKTDLVTEGSASTTLKGLEPGEYTFYCTVPGHREAGMEGTLVVK